jgi:hypothetical protein
MIVGPLSQVPTIEKHSGISYSTPRCRGVDKIEPDRSDSITSPENESMRIIHTLALAVASALAIGASPSALAGVEDVFARPSPTSSVAAELPRQPPALPKPATLTGPATASPVIAAPALQPTVQPVIQPMRAGPISMLGARVVLPEKTSHPISMLGWAPVPPGTPDALMVAPSLAPVFSATICNRPPGPVFPPPTPRCPPKTLFFGWLDHP